MCNNKSTWKFTVNRIDLHYLQSEPCLKRKFRNSCTNSDKVTAGSCINFTMIQALGNIALYRNITRIQIADNQLSQVPYDKEARCR